MSRFYEEAQERRLHAHIARELGVTPEVLDNHPYQLDANESDDGVTYSWRVEWDDVPPPGVDVHGAPGSQWSNISEMHEPDGPEEME